MSLVSDLLSTLLVIRSSFSLSISTRAIPPTVWPLALSSSWNLVVVISVPLKLLTDKATFGVQYSLKILSTSSTSTSLISVLFTLRLKKKSNSLKFANHFAYDSPLDLLFLCKSSIFGHSPFSPFLLAEQENYRKVKKLCGSIFNQAFIA